MKATLRVLGFGAALLAASVCSGAPKLDRLTLPPGFAIALYSDQTPNARELALGAKGTVFVASSNAGKVYALTDSKGVGRADRVRVVASGLSNPLGVAFHDGDLYVSAISRILVLRDIENHLDAPPKPEVVTDKLPDETHHGGRFLGFGPDGRLYVPIGAPCNVCDRPGFAKILSMKTDGSDWRDVAFGVRNSVGFDWQPGSGQMWFTDNGRDMMGDHLPSDELNRLARNGENFGFPFCHQGDTLDPEFGKGRRCSDYTAPVVKLGAHVASLGMRFYTGNMFPPKYRGAIFIAEHGSWNRSTKSGYQVADVRFDGGKPLGAEVFIDGFQHDQIPWGRPVDVLVMPDGALLVSDDLAGAVYRVTYQAPVAPVSKE